MHVNTDTHCHDNASFSTGPDRDVQTKPKKKETRRERKEEREIQRESNRSKCYCLYTHMWATGPPSRPIKPEIFKFTDRGFSHRERLVSWCSEPSQPKRITSGLDRERKDRDRKGQRVAGRHRHGKTERDKDRDRRRQAGRRQRHRKRQRQRHTERGRQTHKERQKGRER